MKRLLPYLGGAYIVFLGWYGARHFGDNWRQDLLAGLVGVYVILSLVTYVLEARVRARFDALDPRDLAALRSSDDDVADFLDDRQRVNERTDWRWRVSDVATAISLLAYPPLGYTVWRYREVRGSTPFDGIALSLMIAGGLLYIVWRRRRLRAYRCPQCRGDVARLSGELIRLTCARCYVTWQLGKPIFSDPVPSPRP